MLFIAGLQCHKCYGLEACCWEHRSRLSSDDSDQLEDGWYIAFHECLRRPAMRAKKFSSLEDTAF